MVSTLERDVMENQPLEEDAKKAVEQLGLSESNYTVIEGVGQGCPAGPIYRPQADISNLFLPMVEATLNHLEQRSGKERAFAYFRTRLSDFLHSEALKLDGFEYAKEVGELVESIGDDTDNKEDYDRFFRSFFRSCLVRTHSQLVQRCTMTLKTSSVKIRLNFSRCWIFRRFIGRDKAGVDSGFFEIAYLGC